MEYDRGNTTGIPNNGVFNGKQPWRTWITPRAMVHTMKSTMELPYYLLTIGKTMASTAEPTTILTQTMGISRDLPGVPIGYAKEMVV